MASPMPFEARPTSVVAWAIQKRILRGKLRHAAQRALVGKAHSVSIGGIKNCVSTLVTTALKQTSWPTVSMLGVLVCRR